MYNTELAEKITDEVMRALVIKSDIFREKIEDIVLSNLNAHYKTQSVPAVSSLPTTCNEPGIAY